jgi:PAS domain-containing protein
VEISGYTLDELLGRSHNIVRHPDMPPAAFEDMWRTLQSGQALARHRQEPLQGRRRLLWTPASCPSRA